MFGAYNNAKKKLDDDMIDSFFDAADKRPKHRAKTRDDIIKEIKLRNSYRWWRINHDYKWLRREMKKMGYNPDDARELL